MDVDAGIAAAMAHNPVVRWAATHGCYVMGTPTPRAFLASYLDYTLDGVAEKIACPTLVCEAEDDLFFTGQPEMLAPARSCASPTPTGRPRIATAAPSGWPAPGSSTGSTTPWRYEPAGTSTTAMWLPSGSRSMNSSGAPGASHRLGVEVDATDRAETGVLAQDVRRLDADTAPAGLVVHRRVERQAGGRSGWRDLQPAVLAVLAEAGVAAHLEAELLGVEGERGVLVGDGEHDHADVGDGGRGLGRVRHTEPTGSRTETHRPQMWHASHHVATALAATTTGACAPAATSAA